MPFPRIYLPYKVWRRAVQTLLLLLALGVFAFWWQGPLLHYAWSQASGQWRVSTQAVPLRELLRDPHVPDSLREKIRIVQKIRQFAIDSLGLADTKSYHSLYLQQGPLQWMLVACPPYSLEPYEWHFGPLGSFPYKGFFDQQLLKEEQAALQAQGLDTYVSEIEAWSTLGWLRDPILSSMLQRPEGALANLLIHEMTHATLFLPDSMELNENLASFIGDQGARAYLLAHYGPQSTQWQAYERYLARRQSYAQHMLRGAQQLDSLYASFRPHPPPHADSLKHKLIAHILQQTDTLHAFASTRPVALHDSLPSNAFFVGYRTYRQQQSAFQTELEKEYQNSLAQYIVALKRRWSK